MTSWFTNGWLRLGSKKRGQQLGSKDENDKENEGWYPTNKKAKKTVRSAFAGAKPSNQGSWLLCQDREGRMYWWNDVTGQWTYQLYSSAQQQQQGQGYVQQQQQQHLLQQQQNQQMMPQMHHQMSYPQQQHSAAHLYNTSSHSLTRSASMSALGGASPQVYMAQHEPWGLASPSTSTAMTHGASAAAAAASAVGGFGLGWASGLSSRGSGLGSRGSASSASADGSGTRMSFFGLDDEDDDDEEYEQLHGAAAGSAWDKFFDGQGRPVWIHSRTGARTTIDPERTSL